MGSLSRLLSHRSPSKPKSASVNQEDGEMARDLRSKSKSESVDPNAMEVDEGKGKGKAKEVEQEGEEEVAKDGEGGEGSEEEEEGEYEVETILDHTQKGGKFEYLVAWKGYGPEHNTWEPEDHVAHAENVVQRYWESKPKGNLKKQTAKRGRPSASEKPAKAAKTKANGSGRTKVEDDEDEDFDIPAYSDTHVDSTDKYKDVKDWEETVDTVDTIERGADGDLVVYLTMTGGEKIACSPAVVYKRCPQKILQFYEAHLKWRNLPTA